MLLQPSKELLYSRSKGILESGLLEKRKVAIVGLGSGGSFIAVELAKAGVGHFILIDFDRIELNNIARHVCGLGDLGRLKTNAVRDILLNKNPFITIETHCSNINKVHEARKILKDCDLIVAATDNVRSRLNINSIAIEHNIPTLFGKCSVRAAGGEVLRVRPNDGPCFSCVFTNQSLEASQEEVCIKYLNISFSSGSYNSSPSEKNSYYWPLWIKEDKMRRKKCAIQHIWKICYDVEREKQ